jgi:RNA polymerase primary sigma factor
VLGTNVRQEDRLTALGRYFSAIREHPLLSREEEAALSRSIKNGDTRAVNRLVEANLGFVVRIAREYRNLGLPFEDLLNEGNLGLLEAARRYDADRGTRFLTCAVWWIRKSILRALNEKAGMIRIPARRRRLMKELREAEQALTRELGRRPENDELSDRFSESTSVIDRLRRTHHSQLSLDETVTPDSESRFVDLLSDAGESDPEEELLSREAARLVDSAVSQLTEKERTVIAYRFGLEGQSPLVLSAVGELLGISRERVRQIESQAIQRLRRILARARFVQAPPRRPASPVTVHRGQPGLVH